jgi:adenine-specific DNA-methyltransferase
MWFTSTRRTTEEVTTFRYSDARFHDPDADGSDAVYVSNEDGGRHTKWLNFMAPRLAMIHELMAPHAVIFASISDVELFRLGMLIDEVFDERNRIGVVVWKGSADNNPTRLAVEHEYILCYAKRLTEVPQVWSSPYDDIKESLMLRFQELKRESTDAATLRRRWGRLIRENKGALGRLDAYTEVDERGPYQGARRVHNPKPGGYEYDVIHPTTRKPCKQPLNGYRYPEQRMKELALDDRIVFGKSHEQIVQMKDYLTDYRDSLRSVIDLDARAGTNTLKALFGKSFDGFRNPKPVELIERLIGAAERDPHLVSAD